MNTEFYLIHYTNSINQSLGKSGDTIILELDHFPTTKDIRGTKVNYLGSLLILAVSIVPAGWSNDRESIDVSKQRDHKIKQIII
jgi:hypothetical protein